MRRRCAPPASQHTRLGQEAAVPSRVPAAGSWTIFRRALELPPHFRNRLPERACPSRRRVQLLVVQRDNDSRPKAFFRFRAHGARSATAREAQFASFVVGDE
jgi:hypothetical protein